MSPEWSQGTFPYAGTSGYAAGSDTSEARARLQDEDGTTTRWQRLVLGQLADQGEHGATWTELAALLHLHHGQASGVLSGLHKAGRLAMLQESRHRCHVYVLPEHVADRPTRPHASAKHTDPRYVLSYASATEALAAEGLVGRDAARARRAMARLGVELTQ